MAQDNVFKLGEDTYAVGRMDPRAQLLVLKRLMRFVPAYTRADKFTERLKAGEGGAPESLLDLFSSLAPIVADTPDADLDFVCDTCMSVTLHQGKNGDTRWYPVRDPQSGIVSNMNNEAPMRKLLITYNALRIVLAPMMAEIAPTIAGSAGPDEAAA